MLLVVVELGLLLVNESWGVLIGVSRGAHCRGQCQASWLACLIKLNIPLCSDFLNTCINEFIISVPNRMAKWSLFWGQFSSHMVFLRPYGGSLWISFNSGFQKNKPGTDSGTGP